MEKYHKTDISPIEKENERDENYKADNPQIDSSKTIRNYHLALRFNTYEKIKRLTAEKASITKKIDNLVNMGLTGSLQDIFNAKLKELKEKYEYAELQIGEIKTVLAKEDDLSKKIGAYIKFVSNIRGGDLNRQARIIKSLVRKVGITCGGKSKKDFTVSIESVFGKDEFSSNRANEKPTFNEKSGLSLVAPRRIELRIQP